ncbi:hypothetical protein QYS48_31770 [Marivirga arenosa]|uniref:Uncharacterized protein n=1 Tax=Marivirga arenosa TaxID=3059076 RepID=A0AA51N4J8_9BACT|nr:DUF6660 family protein [Marivirga sp. ABR2-2]WMN06147.1 hypothetical protein QYS48_31770 [Marivirga sp. ABR2-2]
MDLIPTFAFVKVLCYILSFYLIALCGIPCSDAKSINNDQEITSYRDLVNENQSHEHNQEEDACSPLCVCHCCHLHFFPITEIPFSHPDLLSGSYSLYYQDFRTIEIFDFLKPPRL